MTNILNYISFAWMIILSNSLTAAEVSIQNINIPDGLLQLRPLWQHEHARIDFTIPGYQPYSVKVPSITEDIRTLKMIPNGNFTEIKLILGYRNDIEGTISTAQSHCYFNNDKPLILDKNIKGDRALGISVGYEKLERGKIRVTCDITTPHTD